MVKKAAKPTTKKPAPKPKPVKAALLPNSETEWRIRDDADTLKRAMAIKSDPSRLKAAQDYATQEMDALKKISKMK